MAGGGSYSPEFKVSDLFGGIAAVRSHIRAAVQQARLHRALTTDALASISGLDPNATERYLRGEDMPFREVSLLMWPLGLTIDDVLPKPVPSKDVERARVERYLADMQTGSVVAASGSAPTANPELEMDLRLKLQLLAELDQDPNKPPFSYVAA